jgi:carboxymethylenebutenolidase
MCFDHDSRPPELPAGRALPPIAGGAAAESLTLRSADGSEFAAALAETPEPGRAAVVLLPDNRGLYRFYVELAERLAAAGHATIAFDYFGRSAGVGERGDDFDFMAHLGQTSVEGIRADLTAARDALVERTGAATVLSVGFCFGGTHSFMAGTDSDLGLDGCVGFYGLLNPERIGSPPGVPSVLDEAAKIAGPVLGVFGGADETIPADDIAALESTLAGAAVDHRVKTFPGAPHSFFDRKYEEHAAASADAWEELLDFLGRFGEGLDAG